MTVSVIVASGQPVCIDDADYEFCRQWAWYLSGNKNHRYASRSERRAARRWTVYLHVAIAARAGISTENEIDHINGDQFDCRRKNLRPATRSENCRSVRKWSRGKGDGTGNYGSKFKGVRRLCAKGKRKGWQARILVNGKTVAFSGFGAEADGEIAAARAYDVAAVTHFGAFAKTNFPVTDYLGLV